MKVLEVLKVLPLVVVLLVSLEQSEGVQCFARLNLSLQQCHEEIGEVDEDDCCQNPHYGYKASDGECRSCGPPEWSPWSPWSPCNVLCGEGVTQRNRKCHGIVQPECESVKENLQTRACTSFCCDALAWSSWLSWSTCSVTCGGGGIRKRQRVCAGPPECSSGCSGPSEEMEECGSDTCPVNAGSWGSWAPFSSCPVTCGVGIQVSTRRCNISTSINGGQQCVGEGRRTKICHTNVFCPVNGVWSEWSPWTPCESPFASLDIQCKQIVGIQMRNRECLHKAHNGSICSDGTLIEKRFCYDVDACYVPGNWEGWEPWSLCQPPCGAKSKRFQRRICKPDYSNYHPTIGRMNKPATFFGKPLVDCVLLPEERKLEILHCLNVPACP